MFIKAYFHRLSHFWKNHNRVIVVQKPRVSWPLRAWVYGQTGKTSGYWSQPRLHYTCLFLTLVLLNPDIPCLCKQCRSRSVGLLKPTDLDRHCLPFSNWIYINNLDQVIWLAENLTRGWRLNLFSRTRIKGNRYTASKATLSELFYFPCQKGSTWSKREDTFFRRVCRKANRKSQKLSPLKEVQKKKKKKKNKSTKCIMSP